MIHLKLAERALVRLIDLAMPRTSIPRALIESTYQADGKGLATKGTPEVLNAIDQVNRAQLGLYPSAQSLVDDVMRRISVVNLFYRSEALFNTIQRARDKSLPDLKKLLQKNNVRPGEVLASYHPVLGVFTIPDQVFNGFNVAAGHGSSSALNSFGLSIVPTSMAADALSGDKDSLKIVLHERFHTIYFLINGFVGHCNSMAEAYVEFSARLAVYGQATLSDPATYDTISTIVFQELLYEIDRKQYLELCHNLGKQDELHYRIDRTIRRIGALLGTGQAEPVLDCLLRAPSFAALEGRLFGFSLSN